MPSSTQDAVIAEIRNARADLSRLVDLAESILANVRGIYRRAGKAPVQPPLPGLVADDSPMPAPGEIARTLPRQWSDVVKVFDALCERFGAEEFATGRTFDAATVAAVNAKTSRAIQPQTVNRMLSYFVVAGAASRPRRGVFRLEAPTDELRVRIEEEAKTYHAKMNARRPARGEPSNLRTCEPSNGGREAAHA